jgi:adenylate kinase family enzyme
MDLTSGTGLRPYGFGQSKYSALCKLNDAVARIVIIGNAAGGKSTLARHLARRKVLPLIEADKLLWQEGWRLTPAETYARQHAELIGRDSWVIEGLGSQKSIPERMARATEIVLIDLPLWMHFCACSRAAD